MLQETRQSSRQGAAELATALAGSGGVEGLGTSITAGVPSSIGVEERGPEQDSEGDSERPWRSEDTVVLVRMLLADGGSAGGSLADPEPGKAADHQQTADSAWDPSQLYWPQDQISWQQPVLVGERLAAEEFLPAASVPNSRFTASFGVGLRLPGATFAPKALPLPFWAITAVAITAAIFLGSSYSKRWAASRSRTAMGAAQAEQPSAASAEQSEVEAGQAGFEGSWAGQQAVEKNALQVREGQPHLAGRPPCNELFKLHPEPLLHAPDPSLVPVAAPTAAVDGWGRRPLGHRQETLCWLPGVGEGGSDAAGSDTELCSPTAPEGPPEADASVHASDVHQIGWAPNPSFLEDPRSSINNPIYASLTAAGPWPMLPWLAPAAVQHEGQPPLQTSPLGAEPPRLQDPGSATLVPSAGESWGTALSGAATHSSSGGSSPIKAFRCSDGEADAAPLPVGQGTCEAAAAAAAGHTVGVNRARNEVCEVPAGPGVQHSPATGSALWEDSTQVADLADRHSYQPVTDGATPMGSWSLVTAQSVGSQECEVAAGLVGAGQEEEAKDDANWQYPSNTVQEQHQRPHDLGLGPRTGAAAFEGALEGNVLPTATTPSPPQSAALGDAALCTEPSVPAGWERGDAALLAAPKLGSSPTASPCGGASPTTSPTCACLPGGAECLTAQQVTAEVVLGPLLGVGSAGSVYKATWRGRQVAVKMIHPSHQAMPTALAAFNREVALLGRVGQHPHVAALLAACREPPHCCLIQELAQRGSLWKLLHEDGLRPQYGALLQLAEDVASALHFCHQLSPPVVHRDLKTHNILIASDGRARLCDFGLAKHKDHTFLSNDQGATGTAAYMAPEVFSAGPVDEKADVWAFGCILWECLTGRQPWGQCDNIMQIIMAVGVEKKRLPIPANCSPALRKLISECWRQRPSLRPSFAEVLQRLRDMRVSAARPDQAARSPTAVATKVQGTSPSVAKAKYSPYPEVVAGSATGASFKRASPVANTLGGPARKTSAAAGVRMQQPAWRTG
ncbi:hypothetical protein N2152v2_007481 [Parachlorella kessleri]